VAQSPGFFQKINIAYGKRRNIHTVPVHTLQTIEPCLLLPKTTREAKLEVIYQLTKARQIATDISQRLYECRFINRC